MTQDTVIKALRDAADLIEKPGSWTRGAYARTSEGDPCGFTDPEASCWCAVGAVWKVTNGRKDYPEVLYACRDTLYRRGWSQPLSRYNDAQETPAPVAALMRETADRLEKAGAQP